MVRERIISTARSQEGIKESPPGSNRQKYGQWYGMNGVKWCAIFVSWVYHKAGYPLGKIETKNGYHYCQGAFNHWKAKGELTREPKPGDIVLYDWKGDGHCDHTGIFDSWTDNARKKFYAWEGNTEFGNDSDGGKVMKRERSVALVKAFVSPAVLAGKLFGGSFDTLKLGDEASGVTFIQKLLWEMKYEVDVDGIFGPQTEAAVKKFQTDAFLDPTGIVTPMVRGAMEEELTIRQQTEKKASTASYLQKGDAGAAVKELQEALKAAMPELQLKADGIFGEKTLAALKQYQSQQGIEADGVAGPKTFASLAVTV